MFPNTSVEWLLTCHPQIHGYYRATGASLSKAQAEFTTNVLSNEGVRWGSVMLMVGVWLHSRSCSHPPPPPPQQQFHPTSSTSPISRTAAAQAAAAGVRQGFQGGSQGGNQV